MWILGPIGFSNPWLLCGLLVLPVLWVLLRAVPPSPNTVRFPGVALLLGLNDKDSQTARTPWWLLLLRLCVISALIVAFSGPILNPKTQEQDATPLIVLADGTWAGAPLWPAQIERLDDILEQAERANRLVAFAIATDVPAGGLVFAPARDWRVGLAGRKPAAYTPDAVALVAAIEAIDGAASTIWLSDGTAYEGRSQILTALQNKGAVSVIENTRPVLALGPVTRSDDGVTLDVHRLGEGSGRDIKVLAMGPDPTGIERILGQANVILQSNVTPVQLALRPELMNRVTRFQIENERSAAAVQLVGDSLKRPDVALVSGGNAGGALELLSHLHYLRTAFMTNSNVIEGAISDMVLANPDVIVLADVARLANNEAADLLEWTRSGGVLLRFSGPKLAASNVSRDALDPLMPVRLRVGGRSLGGAMSWGEPKQLRPFGDTSPFYGLTIPADVTVSSQVMAQPDPDLSARVIATLADGTPLVTRKPVGQGQVVLFHVTANAQWSNLPLSGLFLSMLQRLTQASNIVSPETEDLAGQVLSPISFLDGFGSLSDAGLKPSVQGDVFTTARASTLTPAGIYQSPLRASALNVFQKDDVLAPAQWDGSVTFLASEQASETSLKPFLLSAALFGLAADILATLVLTGRLMGLGRAAVWACIVCLSLAVSSQGAQAQEAPDAFLQMTSSELTLAYVVTGDDAVDTTSRQGLLGVSNALTARTSVEPAAPIGVDLETDPLGVFPLIYWPITRDQAPLSAQANAKLNAYMRSGGTVFFDTRDGDISGFGQVTPLGHVLRNIAAALDVPPLEPVPQDHVLSRSFYLLDDFPGRYVGADVWVEQAATETEAVEGMPFRSLNDNVSPVIIGANDWASAWAVSEDGRALRPVGAGTAGERQREMAYRFGVNLIMYVLTGSYKSDQVHIPALLERLGE